MLPLHLPIRRASPKCWLQIGLCLAFLGTSCRMPKITAATVGVGMAQLSSSGSFGASDSGSVVTSSLDSLGLAQEEDALLPRVFLRDGRGALEVSAFRVEYEGQGSLEETITLNGTTLAAGTAVDSSFGMGVYSGVLTWDVAHFGSSILGLGIGFEWIDMDVGLDESAGALSLTSTQRFPLPLVGVRFAGEDNPVSASLNVGWIGLSAPEATATVLDVDGRVDVQLFGRYGGPIMFGTLGYRNFDMDVSYDDGGSQIEAGFEIGGPYVGLRLSF